MATNSNPLNVYKGPAALQHYFDPDQQPPLPLVELPEKLNPFYGDGVRIYAKIMSMHPANNVKAIPGMRNDINSPPAYFWAKTHRMTVFHSAINLLSHTVVPGKTKTVIEYSSGSTVISMSMVARIFHGITDTRAFLSNKTSKAKLQLMQFFGLGLTLFGGPSQPQPLDPRGGIQDAKRRAMDSEEIVNPNQYGNDSNWQAHVRWTGPQILKQLPEINVICAGMGTSGTMSGLATYFKQTKPSVRTVGVCTAPGDRVPGPRSFDLIQQLTFPWRNVVDVIEEVGAVESFALSLQLCREGVICGPSSGFNLKGLLITVEKMKAAGTLQPLRGTDNGLIHCVFLCCDLPYQYIGEYFSKLGKESFPPIRNEVSIQPNPLSNLT
jgi:cysteine synthase